MLAVLGFVLIGLGFLSRLVSLEVYRRISASPNRDVVPSMLPGTPWVRVGSDRGAMKVIVYTTYLSVVVGMVLVLVGVL